MKYRIGFMDLRLYKRLVDEISEYPNRTLVLFRRGEALLHPQFSQMLNYAKGKFSEIQLATNASLMDKKMAHLMADTLTFLSFSLELPERYKKYRCLDKEKVFENVNYFLSINKQTKTQVSIVKTKDISDKEINFFKNQWLDKVDRVRIYDEHSKNGKFGSLIHSRRKRKTCVKPFHDILIFWDGQIGRCNHDWGEAPLDTIKGKSIKDIWQSRYYQQLRKQHIDLIVRDRVCKNCDSWYDKLGLCKIGKIYEKKQCK
jgi:radical SAM protein with 4Fe4S-binding SPASM domain